MSNETVTVPDVAETRERLRDAVRQVCVGPHLSKSLDRATTATLMGGILAHHAELDSVHISLYLVGLRIKRETTDENAGLLDALQSATPVTTVAVPDLLHLNDPFDGQNRHLPAGVFMAPVFAACGLPTVVYSVPTMGPKFGLTAEKILAAAGADVDATAATAARHLGDSAVRWAYLSQRIATPSLWALQDLRERMVKRPSLSTLEKLLRPVQGQQDWLLTGFIHKEYRQTVPGLARLAGFRYCLAQRGVEGGVTPPLNRDSQIAWMSAAREVVDEETLQPKNVGLLQEIVAPAQSSDAATALTQTLAAGRAALRGETNDTARAIWLQVGQVLWRGHLVDSLAAGIEAARTHCRTGIAWDHWRALTGDCAA